MAIQVLEITDFLKQAEKIPLLDVRAPKEFVAGHIPGAISFPLFSDEERAKVGTTYKQIGHDPAVLMGLDIFGPKMSGFVKAATELAPDKEVALHCWRGGMRSGSVAWLLDFAGFKVNLLKPGYKGFRHFALDHFEKPCKLLMIGGMTGSGKTEILPFLKNTGEQTIDLEQLANHKGSAFGTIGHKPQGTIEQFENDLAIELSEINALKTLWLEDESISIGRINLPKPFHAQMQQAPLIKLEIPFSERIQKLTEEYCKVEKNRLTEAILKIKKRLGGLATQEALQAIEQDDFSKMVEIALVYYDKAYTFELAHKNPERIYPLELPNCNAAENAAITLDFAKTRKLI
jgi:tRNA 2-selenouridine synthase